MSGPSGSGNSSAATVGPGRGGGGGGGSSGGVTDEERELENLVTVSLVLTRSLRKALSSVTESLTRAGPWRKRKATAALTAEAEEDGVEELVGAEALVEEVKQALNGVTKGYEELEKRAVSGGGKAWKPLLSDATAFLLSKSAMEAAESPSLRSLSEETHGFFLRNNQVSNYAVTFLRGAARIQWRTPPLNPMDPAHLKDYMPKIEENLTSLNGPCVQLNLLDASASSTHAKLMVKVLDGPRQAISTAFQMALFLRAGMMEWVTVMGPEESLEDEEGLLDFSRTSQFLIYRRLSEELKSYALQPALMQTGTGINSLRTLYSFLNRCVRYRSCFTERCKACDRHLKHFLPPYVLLDPRTNLFYHQPCRPQ